MEAGSGHKNKALVPYARTSGGSNRHPGGKRKHNPPLRTILNRSVPHEEYPMRMSPWYKIALGISITVSVLTGALFPFLPSDPKLDGTFWLGFGGVMRSLLLHIQQYLMLEIGLSAAAVALGFWVLIETKGLKAATVKHYLLVVGASFLSLHNAVYAVGMLLMYVFVVLLWIVIIAVGIAILAGILILLSRSGSRQNTGQPGNRGTTNQLSR